MKRKRLILTILSLVVILSLSSLVLWRYLSGKYVETAESIRDYFMYGHEIEMYTVEQGEKRDKRQ